MPDRRTFLHATLSLPLLATLRTRPVSDSITIVLLQSPALTPSALAGVRFSAREAEQTARLLKRDFHLVETEKPAIESGALGVIAAEPLAEVYDRVVLLIGRGGPAAPGFRVLPECGGLRAWAGGLEKFGAAQLNARYSAATNRTMDEDAWAGWMAVKIMLESTLRAGARPLTEYLRNERTFFDGHKGVPLRFDAARVLQQPLYDVRAGRSAEVKWEERPCR
jgi:hypothetical protein